jgi:hypothetical protein
MDLNNLVETLKRALSHHLQFPRSALPGQPSWPAFLPERVNIPQDIKDELLAHFRAEDRLSDFDGRLFHRGGGGGGLVTFDMLAQWIVVKAMKSGPEQAVHALEQYMASQFTPGHEILVLAGVEITRRHKIIEDIELIPFSELPRSYETDSLDPQWLRPEILISLGFPPFPQMGYPHGPPKAALIRSIQISPKSFSQDSQVLRLPRWDMLLYQVCECMTLIGPSAPLPRAHWTEVDQDAPCYGWLGGGHGSPTYDVIPRQVYTYRESDLAEMNILVERFLPLHQDTRDRLRVPLGRMNQAIRRTDIPDKAIDLGIALESLLLKNARRDDPISLPFRLRGAWLLGHDAETRRQFLLTFRSLYDLRSGAVHSGKLDDKVKVPRGGKVETKTFLDDGIKLCGQAIRKIIADQEFPDWDSLVLGA